MLGFEGYTIEMLQQRFIIGTLMFVRVTALFSTAPIFNNPAINTQVKVIMSAFIALLMTTAFAHETPAIDFHLWTLVPLVFKEAAVGILLGFTSNLLFYAVRFAGGVVDYDMGFQTALLFNPEADVPTLIGEFHYLVALMVFFLLNGHHFLIESLYASMKIIPLGGFSIPENTLNLFIKLITTMFIIGVKIASPMLVSLFITNLSLALLSRVAPQINIFTLSFQFKIIVGILVLFISVPLLVILVKNSLTIFERDIMEVLMSIGNR